MPSAPTLYSVSKMSIPQVAEHLAKTAVLAQRFRAARAEKEAFDFGGMAEQAGNWIKDNPMYSAPLLGAGVGAAYGGLTSLAKDPEERTPIRSILSGALAGGALGAGGYAASQAIPKAWHLANNLPTEAVGKNEMGIAPETTISSLQGTANQAENARNVPELMGKSLAEGAIVQAGLKATGTHPLDYMRANSGNKSFFTQGLNKSLIDPNKTKPISREIATAPAQAAAPSPPTISSKNLLDDRATAAKALSEYKPQQFNEVYRNALAGQDFVVPQQNYPHDVAGSRLPAQVLKDFMRQGGARIDKNPATALQRTGYTNSLDEKLRLAEQAAGKQRLWGTSPEEMSAAQQGVEAARLAREQGQSAGMMGEQMEGGRPLDWLRRNLGEAEPVSRGRAFGENAAGAAAFALPMYWWNSATTPSAPNSLGQ